MGHGTGGGAGSGGGKFSGKKCRLVSMFCLTTAFFLLEIVTGYVTNSMALVADSFHMLSDIAALVIAFVSVRMAPKSWSKNTFGWARAEVLGALVNAVFLVALCFSITVESMKRFYEPEDIHNPVMILYVGGMGLAVNLVGLCLFHEHGSSHGHSHGLTRSTHSHLTDLADREEKDAEISEIYPPQHNHGHSHGGHGHSHHSASNMNMRGVFLHVMADALGSVVVIISAIIMWQTDWEYKLYVDPGLSLLLVILILRSVWPLLIDSALILLQTVPTHIQIDTLQRKLMEKVDGILAVHEFHVWQLTGDRIIASAHIRCLNLAQYMEVAEKVKEFFHHEGIHSTTIQPEFIETSQTGGHAKLASTEDCVLACPKLPQNSLAGCEASKCCPPGSKTSSANSQDRSRQSSPGHRRPSSVSIAAETTKGFSTLLVGQQVSRRSAPDLSIDDPSPENTATEMTAELNLSDSPQQPRNTSFRQNPEVPLSISQFTTPVKPLETSTRLNTPNNRSNSNIMMTNTPDVGNKPQQQQQIFLPGSGGRLSRPPRTSTSSVLQHSRSATPPSGALHQHSRSATPPSGALHQHSRSATPPSGAARTMSRDNSGVYNRSLLAAVGVTPLPPASPLSTSLDQQPQAAYDSPALPLGGPDNQNLPPYSAVSGNVVGVGDLPASAVNSGGSVPPRKTSTNSSTGGEDNYDDGEENTPMVPRTKARIVRVISKQSNV